MKRVLSKSGVFAIALLIASLFFINSVQAQVNTGLRSPTTSVNTNSVTNVGNALASDNLYAIFNASGDAGRYGGFSLTTADGGVIPAGASIIGIEVQLEGNMSGGARTLDISLTWDNATSFTTPITMAQFTSSTDAFRTVPATGGSTNLWGHAWTVAELSNANFGIRCVVPAASTNDINLDHIQVRVYYCAPPAAPVVSSPVNYCLNTTASSLTATGTGLLWYTTPSGPPAGTSVAPTPSTAVVGAITYYVSQTIGCEGPRAPVVVNVLSLPTTSFTKTDVQCFNTGTGTITVTGIGGTSPYTYSINNGSGYQAGNTFNNLPAAAYQIRVKDINGCQSKLVQ